MMMTQFSKICIFLVCTVLLVASLMCCSTAHAKVDIKDKTSGNIIFTTDRIRVEVTGGGNVPKFSVRSANMTDNSDDDDMPAYKVQMQHAFQASSSDAPIMKNRIPATQVALSSLAWDFSEAILTDESLHFNITSLGGTKQNKAHVVPEHQFRVHVNDKDAGFKFDIAINGMTADMWDAKATHYVICFKLIEQKKDGEKDLDAANPTELSDENKRLSFGRARFDIEGTAQAEKRINTKLALDTEEGKKLICIAYEKWEGESMLHDPTFGVVSSAALDLSAARTLLLPLGTLLLCLASMFIL